MSCQVWITTQIQNASSRSRTPVNHLLHFCYYKCKTHPCRICDNSNGAIRLKEGGRSTSHECTCPLFFSVMFLSTPEGQVSYFSLHWVAVASALLMRDCALRAVFTHLTCFAGLTQQQCCISLGMLWSVLTRVITYIDTLYKHYKNMYMKTYAYI